MLIYVLLRNNCYTETRDWRGLESAAELATTSLFCPNPQALAPDIMRPPLPWHRNSEQAILIVVLFRLDE